jgi:hypothetical protein
MSTRKLRDECHSLRAGDTSHPESVRNHSSDCGSTVAGHGSWTQDLLRACKKEFLEVRVDFLCAFPGTQHSRVENRLITIA